MARVLGRYDEAIAHNAPIIEGRREENRKSDELRKAKHLAEAQAEKEKYSKAIEDAEASIAKRVRVENEDINGKSLIMSSSENMKFLFLLKHKDGLLAHCTMFIITMNIKNGATTTEAIRVQCFQNIWLHLQ